MRNKVVFSCELRESQRCSVVALHARPASRLGAPRLAELLSVVTSTQRAKSIIHQNDKVRAGSNFEKNCYRVLPSCKFLRIGQPFALLRLDPQPILRSYPFTASAQGSKGT